MLHDPTRPTFERTIMGVDQDTLADRIAAALHNRDSQAGHRRTGEHFLIWIPPERRRFWSPWLHLDVRRGPDPAGSATLFGRFMPAPSIWTGFMLAHLSLWTTALFAVIFGFSQLIVKQSPWAFWLVPLTLITSAVMIAASRIGQRLARHQMADLTAAIDGVLVLERTA
ncbi:MAG: hypothetical protein AAGG07_01170 [Planctomycetota bacterium]